MMILMMNIDSFLDLIDDELKTGIDSFLGLISDELKTKKPLTKFYDDSMKDFYTVSNTNHYDTHATLKKAILDYVEQYKLWGCSELHIASKGRILKSPSEIYAYFTNNYIMDDNSVLIPVSTYLTSEYYNSIS